MSILSLTAVELSDKIKKGEIRVTQALDEVFAQIEEKEAQLNCYVTLEKEKAYTKAEEVQKKIDSGGLYRSENAGMSSENYVGIIMAENLRFLGEGSSAQGKPGAKARPKGVVDAHTVEIP